MMMIFSKSISGTEASLNGDQPNTQEMLKCTSVCATREYYLCEDTECEDSHNSMGQLALINRYV